MKPFLPEKVKGGWTVAMVPVLLAFLIVQPFNGAARADDTFTQTLNNVEFDAVPTGIGSYDLDFTNISYSSGYDELLYTTNLSDGWTMLSPGAQVVTLTGLTGQQSIWLEISNGTIALTDGTLQFTGPAGTNLYNGLDVTWQLPGGVSGLNVSFVTPDGAAHLSPIPIPAPAILLGSGLLGLIGMGICKRKIPPTRRTRQPLRYKAQSTCRAQG